MDIFECAMMVMYLAMSNAEGERLYLLIFPPMAPLFKPSLGVPETIVNADLDFTTSSNAVRIHEGRDGSLGRSLC